MRRCERAFCRHCGRSLGLFKLNGFGVVRRYHEARCTVRTASAAEQRSSAPPAAQVGKVLLPQVDRLVDMNLVPVDCVVQTLFMSKEDLLQLNVENQDLCREVLIFVVVTWRPGSYGGAPLRPALRLGKDEGSIVIRAKVPHRSEMREQSVPIASMTSW